MYVMYVSDVYMQITNELAKYNQDYCKKCTYSKYLSSRSENDKIEYERLRRETKRWLDKVNQDLEIYIPNKK